ncbi:MAG: hypothetical protein BRD55_06175 [Bacteroidetes bacterium SW_9_63_38]|nr:MAG: hypothetical protein BRD55_06175 [Bacteroidetes bacterium SW_9_63_38]
MTRFSLLAATLFLVVGLLGTAPAQAQTDFRLGPRLGADFGDADVLFIGADARIDTPALPVTINPTFDVYFIDPGSLVSISGNALFSFGVVNQVFDPYAGGGLGVYRFGFENAGSSTDIGLNFIFGAEFEVGSLQPFAEAQVSPVFTENTATLFSLKGGVLFDL